MAFLIFIYFVIGINKIISLHMILSHQIAKNFREVYFGGNWTASSLKNHLQEISWKQATTKVSSLNTIVSLVYYINYFVIAVTEVLQAKPLKSHDKYSFDHPVVSSQKDWENLLIKAFEDAQVLANLIEQLPESTLWQDFTDKKYGTYYRNLQGLIEHNLKKLINNNTNQN